MTTTNTTATAIASAVAAETRRLDQLVDRYAELHSQKTDTEIEMELIKAQLIATGQSRIKGTFLTASISTAAPARRTNWQAVAVEMKAPPEIIDLHTKTADCGVTALRLVAN
jgi:hypothetical protein